MTSSQIRRKKAYRPSITITPGRRVTEYRVPCPDDIDPLRRWFLVYTAPKAEAKAKIELERAGYTTFLPTFRREIVRTRGKPIETLVAMFPRYLFISGNGRFWPSHVNGVQDVVRNGLDWAAIPRGVIEAIVAYQAVPLAEVPTLKEGDKVELMEGPFAEFLGTVSKVLPSGKARLLIQCFGTETNVEVDIAKLVAA